MKININDFSILRRTSLVSLFALASLVFCEGVRAEAAPTLTTLYSFPLTAQSGNNPTTALVQANDGNFYGTTENGGPSSTGTIFKITPAGALTTLHTFAQESDGGEPRSPLLLASDGNLYGMTYGNDANATFGTVYRITPAGAFTTLKTFSGVDGDRPQGNLIQATDGNIYATTSAGGETFVSANSVGDGNVIKITLAGTVTTFASLHYATEGSQPLGGVVQATDGNFYGSAARGSSSGASSFGNIFKLTPGGVLSNFAGFDGAIQGVSRSPNRIIQASDGNFYGTAQGGGSNFGGTVFKVGLDGTVTKLHDFASYSANGGDGSDPHDGLVQATDGNFYGTTQYGGTTGNGTIFRITPDGTYTAIYSFTGNGGSTTTDGGNPLAALIQGRDGKLYGTTSAGGTSGGGTVFVLDAGLPAPLVANFTVNESSSPSAAAPDSVLRFRAVENHDAAGLLVHVQSSTAPAPAPESSWTDLPDGLSGRMVYAPQVTSYILNSTNYPSANGISFRAVTRAHGYPDAVSNVVGPFNLQSSTPHLGPTLLFVTTNGEINAIRFGVNEATVPAGTNVRVQTTQTPAIEGSWTNAPVGNAGVMTQDPSDTKQFYLGTDSYPEGEGNYFRAMADSTGSVPSYSIPYGPFKFVTDPAATVMIRVNGASTAPNDIDGGYLLPSGTFNIAANASSGRFIKRLTLLFDGNVVGEFDSGATNGALDYTTNIPGDHIVEAYATDDLGVTGAAAPIHVRILPVAPGKIYQMTASGDWNNSSNWIDIQGNHGVPGVNDFAIVSTFSPTLSTDVTVNAMSLNGGTLDGASTLTVTGFCTIADGAIKANLTIPAGATAECLNDTDIILTGKLTYSGTMRLHGKGGIGGMHSVAKGAMRAGADTDGFFDFVGGIINGVGKLIADLASGGRRGSKAAPAAHVTIANEQRTIAAASINISGGTVTAIPAPAKLISQDGGGLLSQDGGGLISQDGGGLVASGAGNLVAQGAGNLVAQGAGNLLSQDGGGLVAQGAGNLVATGAGNLVAQGAGNLVAQGAGNRPAFRTAATESDNEVSGISLTGGDLNLSGLTVYGNISMNGGVLSGSGIILGDLTNSGGYISPGHSPGAIAVTGAFAQEANGTLIIENGGPTADEFDQLLVGGAASLGGKLIVHTINGYIPDLADTFSPLGYSSVSGSFDSVSGNTGLTLTNNGALLTTNPNVASPIDSALRNIATRARVGTGNNVLIGGFIVRGTAPKKVLVRAVGPSLPFAGVLPDPVLELHEGDGTVVTNDNWRSEQEQEIIASGLAPSNNLESAIIATLAPGAHTIVMRGKGSDVGVGVVEIYELDTSAVATLLNISSRGRVETGDNVMIGGIIVGGTEPASVLVRAVGPSLKNAGLSSVLEDPTLELHDANGGVFTNDDWREAQEGEITATTLAPSDNKESAMLVNLVPGAYTAIVRGKDNGTGIALVEAYKVK